MSTASTASTLDPREHGSPMASALSPALSADERRSLRRAVGLLNLDRSRFILAVLTGTAAMASAVALSGGGGLGSLRGASQMPDVVALGVAAGGGAALRHLALRAALLRAARLP